jgi:hypothetical protein
MLAVNTLVHRREGRGTLEEMLVRRGARHAGGNGDVGAPPGRGTLEEMEMLVRCGAPHAGGGRDIGPGGPREGQEEG